MAIVFQDDFNRADSPTVGNGWIEQDPTVSSIFSNKLRMDANFTVTYETFCRAPAAADGRHMEYTVDFVHTAGFNFPQIWARTDGGGASATGYYAEIDTSGGNLNIVRANGTSSTPLVGTSVPLTIGTNYRLRFKIQDDEDAVCLKEAELYNLDAASTVATVSESADITYLRSGFVALACFDDIVDYDNFIADELSPLPPPQFLGIKINEPMHNGSELMASRSGITARIFDYSDLSHIETITGLTTDIDGVLERIVTNSVADGTLYDVVLYFSQTEINYTTGAEGKLE